MRLSRTILRQYGVCMFGRVRLCSGSGGEIFSLMYVECDDNGVCVVCAGEDKGVDEFAMI